MRIETMLITVVVLLIGALLIVPMVRDAAATLQDMATTLQDTTS